MRKPAPRVCWRPGRPSANARPGSVLHTLRRWRFAGALPSVPRRPQGSRWKPRSPAAHAYLHAPAHALGSSAAPHAVWPALGRG
eukprot:1041975-Alexandrium_andersonii.AAC.1